MDRTTKILLLAIATGLWANAMPNVIRSAQAIHYGQSTELANTLENAVTLIANGGCNNAKLCDAR